MAYIRKVTDASLLKLAIPASPSPPQACAPKTKLSLKMHSCDSAQSVLAVVDVVELIFGPNLARRLELDLDPALEQCCSIWVRMDAVPLSCSISSLESSIWNIHWPHNTFFLS